MPGEVDTIAALATPPGKGAIALLRVSGSRARALLQKHFSTKAKPAPRRPSLGAFIDRSGNTIDQVLVTWFPAPASYTGEDVVEISCHGSPLVAAQILDVLLESGARLANPGEFTLRAFLGGKMDLAQAEAIRDLIDSQTTYQATLARRQMEGELSMVLGPLKGELIRICSHLETRLEFVEDEVDPEGAEQLGSKIMAVSSDLASLLATFEVGRVVREGFEVAIAGPTNAGKSSLFNALVERDRAIVTTVHGTTRDAITETIQISGIPVRLADTAGIREATDPVESLGVEKSRRLMADADLVLFVVDSSVSFGESELAVWEQVKAIRPVLVLNKLDLARRCVPPAEVESGVRGRVEVSALTGQGLGDLRSAIADAFAPPEGWNPEGVLITSARHRDCLRRARGHLEAAQEALHRHLSEEFPAYDVRKALEALGEITGETTVDDILNEIFSSFCIGK